MATYHQGHLINYVGRSSFLKKQSQSAARHVLGDEDQSGILLVDPVLVNVYNVVVVQLDESIEDSAKTRIVRLHTLTFRVSNLIPDHLEPLFAVDRQVRGVQIWNVMLFDLVVCTTKRKTEHYSIRNRLAN